jgi:hypothetical protein
MSNQDPFVCQTAPLLVATGALISNRRARAAA